MLELSVAKKKKKFKFTFAVLLRLIIFIFVITGGIMYFSKTTFDVGSNITLPNLPYVNNISTNPAIIQVVNQWNQFRSNSTAFIDNQIKEIKKAAVKKVADQVIENIDKQ